MIKAVELTNTLCEDLARRVQATDSDVARAMIDNPRYAEMVNRAGPAAAFLIDGVVMAAAGLIDYPGSGRAVIWCVFADGIKGKFAGLYKKMCRSLAHFPRRRLEAHIDPEFAAARRLVMSAGFRLEGLMLAFSGDGNDRELWARVKVGT